MKRVPRFAPGGPVDTKKIPEQKPFLQREEKVKVDWKAVGKWLKDFHQQKHPFQKGVAPLKQTKTDRVIMNILGPGKFKVAKNSLVATAHRIAPDLIDKVKNHFSSSNTVQKVIDEAKFINSLPHPGREGMVGRIGEERYDEYLKNFTEIYKNQKLSQSVRKEIGSSRWSKSVQDAKKVGHLTQADVDKYGKAGATKGWVTRREMQGGLTFKEQKWQALQDTLNELATGAPTHTEKGVTKPFLPHLWDGAENVIPVLKEKYPDLFYDWDVAKKTDWKKYRQLKSGDNMPSRDAVKVPDFFKDLSQKGSSMMTSSLPQYTGTKKGVAMDTQYFMDMFRSRPSDIRTGNVRNDTIKFLDFYKNQGVFNPASEVFYKNDPEYLNYIEKRKEQPEGTHLAHMTPTLVPDKSQTVPFSGADVELTQFLPSEVNTELQPTLETELKKLLKQERTPENIKNIQQVEKTMIDNNIITQMTDPQTGDTRYYGGTKDLEMNRGGMIQKFAEGTDDKGVEATGISSEPLSEEQDTSGVAGLMDEDLNRFIPPHLRFAKNLTGNTVLDFGAEMARYMTPGLGEYLSHEDYKLYSSELAQAFKNKEFLTAAGLSIPTMLAMAGTAIPNHSLVGIPISAAEAMVKKAIKPKLKQLEKPKDIRYKIRDKDGKTVYQTKNKQEAEEHAQRLSGETGEDFIVDEIEFMPKEKVEVMESKPYDIVNDAGQVIATRRNKNQAEKYLKRHPNENLRMIERNLPDVPRLDPKRLVDVGDNRQFYSKSQQAFDEGFDLATGDATLTAKQWRDYFRKKGGREQELVDSYVRTLLDRKGAFNKETQTFTSNAPIKASEIKELIDNSPAMHVQSVQFSDAAGNLKYGTTGRLSGHAAGSKRENVIWIDSADIRGDPGLLSDLAKKEGTQHKDFYNVKSDTVKFDAGKAKLEGEPYIIAWSLVDTRPGKDAFGKTIKVDLASEIQSDLLQKAATRKAKLKQKISQLGTGSPQEVQKLLQEIDYIFRPMGRTATEIQELVQRLTANQQKFTNASKLELDDVTPALLKDLDNAKIDRDNILNEMFAIVDGISINDLYPNVPLKNSKDWVDIIVKNDVYLATKNRFTILDDGTIKVNKNAPSHYAPNNPSVPKGHWSSTGEEAGQMYDIIYNNAADSLKRIAKTTGADVQLGKVKQGGSWVEVPMIELVPEMLYSQVQYFKDGGLVQKQYTPLVSIFKPLGVSYGY